MYIATFHTHFGATGFNRSLTKSGQKGIMCPVPRALSASCGVCVKFPSAENISFSSVTDLDSVYEETDSGCKLIFEAE